MLTWALWTTQLYQHHSVTNIQQATWYPQQNCVQYSAYASNYPTSVSSSSINNLNYSASVPNYHTTQPYYSTVKPSKPSYPKSHEQRKTDITMGTENYYNLTRYNEYSVHFPNRTALSVDEIRDICCEFGEIRSCKQTGNETGLAFVNFVTEDAAKKCVEGLRDHPIIKLRATKLYMASKSNNKDENNSDASKQYDYPRTKKYDYPPSKKHDYPPSSSSSGLNNSLDKDNHKEERIENNNSCQGSEKSYAGVENGSNKKMSDQFPNNTERNYSMPTINNRDNTNRSPLVATDNGLDMGKLSLDEHDSVPMDLPELVPARTKTISGIEVAKNVIEATMDVPKKQPVEVIEAQEIIVANIEEIYGVPAILHLLEKYEPICASPIKTCKSHPIRYCHVFFTNIHQAEAAERDFDEYDWSGDKKLMVLRVNTLASLASPI